jgi:hypothetical protein
MCAGRPTVRKVQLPSGRWMTQEANADTPKGDGKPPTATIRLLRRMAGA